MAESHIPQVNLTAKTVQELVANNEELPENYIFNKDGHGGELADTPVLEVPTVDLSLLSSSTTTLQEEELQRLRLALTSWGCFQAINHSVSSAFLDKLRELTSQFFALPMEEKRKYSKQVNDIQGYGSDTVLSDKQILDWTDRLYLKVNPEDERELEYWPRNPDSFREALDEYSIKLKQITEVIFKAMAKCLNLKENSFLKQYGERPVMFTRFNYYPPCPRSDLVLGLKPHADGSAITIVLLDKQVQGLQFLKDDQWVGVSSVPDALLVNLGDQAEIMSNGIFKSPVHRVVTNSKRERISVAVFCAPELDKEVEPVEELINETRPRMYKKVKNYVDNYFYYFQQGKRPIDAVKV